MFDRSFFFGAVALAGLCAASLGLSAQTGLDFRLVLLSVMLVAWGGFWWLDRHYSKRVSLDDNPIFCEWSERLSRSDFLADTEMTRLGLQELGFSLDSAIGREFTFETERDDPPRTIIFDGSIYNDNVGNIVIRAAVPELLD